MAIDFPDAPSNGDTHTVGDKTWTYDGTTWTLVTGATADHGNLGGLGDDDHTQYLLADGTRTATELTVSGDLTVDTSTLHVDSTSNRVGIGTTSPNSSLHIDSGSATNPTHIFTQGYVANGAADTRTGTVRNAFDSNTDFGTYWTSFRGANGGSYKSLFGVRTGGTDNDVLTVDSSGNVGIGTTTPSTKVDVYTDAAAGAPYPLTLSAKNSSGTKKDYVRVGFGIEQGAAGIEAGGFRVQTLRNGAIANAVEFTGATNAQTWDLYTENISRMRIDTAGRVTTPYQPAFSAYCSYTDFHSAMSGVQIVPFATVLLNRGNGFLTSGTGAYQRFVAPVSGVYWMSISFGVISATTDYYYGMAIYKNGANSGVSHQYYKHSGGGNDDGTSQSFAISLNASDWVDIRTNFQDSKRVQWAVFTGHLLG